MNVTAATPRSAPPRHREPGLSGESWPPGETGQPRVAPRRVAPRGDAAAHREAAHREAAHREAGHPPVPGPLPPLLVLTDRRQAGRPLADVVASTVEGGVRAIVLREKDLPEPDRLRLADRLRAMLPADVLLILAGRPGYDDGRSGTRHRAGAVPAAAGDGAPRPQPVHLPTGAPVPAPRPPLVGRSCHTVAEVRASSDVDYVTVSPVFATPSKPGYGPALGLAGLAALTGLGVPVYALGGVTERSAAGCRAAGAAGIAVMGHVMRASDPAATVRRLLAAWESAAREASHD